MSHLLHIPLGDSKPSALVEEMLTLIGDHPHCFLFKQLFLERLAEDIRVVLADDNMDGHREFAKRAGALWLIRTTGSANAVKLRHPPPPPPTHPSSFVCYHAKFGDKANMCHGPCPFLSGRPSIVASAVGSMPGIEIQEVFSRQGC